MLAKKKICAGCNTEQYIYKNIEGKKYCKSCAYKKEPPKAISKVSQKQKFKLILKQDLIQKDKMFYLNIWREAFYVTLPTTGEVMLAKSPRCENCGTRLGEEPNMCFFHHILEKRNYPNLRHVPENIAILCKGCHNTYETFPMKVPTLVARRTRLLETLNKKQNE